MRQHQKAFTLIELVMVVAILGILAAAALAALNPLGQLQKTNDAKRKSDLSQIQKALDLYYQDNNAYPLSSGGSISVGGANVQCGLNSGQYFQAYMQQVPCDPKDPTYVYTYYSPAGNQSYMLYAHMEKTTGSIGNLPAGTTCGPNGAVCNYGVSSPNASP